MEEDHPPPLGPEIIKSEFYFFYLNMDWGDAAKINEHNH